MPTVSSMFQKEPSSGKRRRADEGTFRGRTKAVGGLREITETEASLPGVPANAGEEHFFCRNLTCRRKKILIYRDLNLSLPAGKITALTGRNGVGENYPRHGSGGTAKAERRGNLYRREKAVCWKAQKGGVVQFQRHRNPVFYHQRHGGIAAPFRCFPGRLEYARTLLKTLGLYAYKDTHPAVLSGGQKQRLSIACGLLSDRKILLFDEPTSGLDGRNMRKIADVLTEAATEGRTILVITHDKEFMQACCGFQWKLCQ